MGKLVEEIDVSGYCDEYVQDGSIVKLQVGIYQDDRCKCIAFTVTDHRYPEPKMYQVSFNCDWMLSDIPEDHMDKGTRLRWFAGVVGRQIAEIVEKSFCNTQSHIGVSFQTFLASMKP